MKKAIEIEIEQAEGRVGCEIHETVEGSGIWAKANAVLRRIAATAPASGGYYKCDFIVTFDDGDTYQGRIDIKRFGNETLEGHIQHHCEFHSGQAKAPWMGEKRYRTFLKDVVKPEAQEAYAKVLAECELGDREPNAQERFIEEMGA